MILLITDHSLSIYFLSCPLVVKRDSNFCSLCVNASVSECVRASVWICPGHNFYIYAWISVSFGSVVVLEKGKCHLKHFR